MSSISVSLSAIEVLILFFLVIGGLFSGWFSPTQAGGAGAAGVLILGLIKRKITCMVMFIVTGAMIFGHFIAVTKIPFLLSDWLSSLPVHPIAIMVLIVLLHLIGGCFMDAFALIVLTVPILLPVVEGLGFDLIWFGIRINRGNGHYYATCRHKCICH